MAGKIGQGMTRFDDEKYHNGSKIQGNYKCKISVNTSAFLSHFFNFHGSKVKGVDEADIESLEFLLLLRKLTIELRKRHGFFVHFQAVLFPEVRFSFIFRCSIETPFTMTAEMLSGEPELTAWVLPKTSLNATVPFLLFSNRQPYAVAPVSGTGFRSRQ